MRIKNIHYIDGYKLEILFSDKKYKVVNFEKWIKKGGMYIEALKDIDYFKKVKCDGFTVVWPNGTDFCPDVLYKMGEDVKKTIKKPKPPAKNKRNIIRRKKQVV